MALSKEQQDFVRQGGAINSPDPQVMADYSAFVKGSSAGATPITSASIAPATAYSLPTPTVDNTNYDTATAGANAQTASFLEYLKSQDADKQPSLESGLTALYGQTSEQIAQEKQLAQQESIKAKSASRQAQADITGIQAEIQSVIDKRDADLLALERDATGRGITTAGLAPSRTAISRQAAIDALPLQSKALIAQAKAQSLQGLAQEAQDTLTMASEKLSKVFEYRMTDAQNNWADRKEQRKSIYDFLTEAEKTRLASIEKADLKNERLYTDAKNNAEALANIATTNGQGDVASEIAQAFAGIDTNSKDLPALIKKAEEKVASLQAKIKPKEDVLGDEIKRLNIRKLQQEISGGGGNERLSVTEAQVLGVPYGTTKAQAIAMNKTPQKQATAAQETTALYANRLEQSNSILTKLDNYAMSQNSVSYKLQQNVPDVANALKSGDFQSVEQAQKNFLNAVLRRESGAVISPTEFTEGKKQYFAQPGDTPNTVAQKKANRDLVQQGFINGAGQAYTPLTTVGGVLRSPDGRQEVSMSDLTPAQITEAKNNGWK